MNSILAFIFVHIATASSSTDCVADGTCKTAEAEDLTMLLQRTSASGVQSASSSEQPSIPVKKDVFSAHGLLQSVENMLLQQPDRSGNMSQFETIRKIVEDTLLPGLIEAHEFAQKQLNESKARIDSCINTSNHAMTVVNGYADSSSQREGTHKACRGIEKSKLAVKTTKCGILQSFIDDTAFPPVPDPRDRALVRTYLITYKGLAITFEGHDAACNQSTAILNNQTALCNGEQATFETHFCEYRDELVRVKADSTKCYGDANTSHSTLALGIEEKVKSWKAEYKAIKKILCYLNVWLGDGNLSTVNKNMAHTCQTDSIDVTAMDIAYPLVPAPKVIDLSPVHDYPGTTGFPSRYIHADISFNVAIASCIAAVVE